MTSGFEEIAEILDDLVRDQLQPVTYKYVARRFNIPYDTSKRILFKYITTAGKNALASFLLSGWTKEERPSHVLRIVDSAALEPAKMELSHITAIHVYAIQPALTKLGCNILGAEITQKETAFGEILTSQKKQDSFGRDELSSVQQPKSTEQSSKPSFDNFEVLRANTSLLSMVSKKSNNGILQHEDVRTESLQDAQSEDEPQQTMEDARSRASAKQDIKQLHKRTFKLDSNGETKPKRGNVIDDSDEDNDPTQLFSKTCPNASDDGNAMKLEDDQILKRRPEQRDNDSNRQRRKLGVETNPSAQETTRKVLKTFVNDSGEEVTEIVEFKPQQENSNSVMDHKEGSGNVCRGSLQGNQKKHNETTKKVGRSVGSTGQRSIASFFSKK